MAIKRKGKIRVAIKDEMYWGYTGWVPKDQWESKKKKIDVEIVGCTWGREDTVDRRDLTPIKPEEGHLFR
jgi:hypothetical protein